MSIACSLLKYRGCLVMKNIYRRLIGSACTRSALARKMILKRFPSLILSLALDQLSQLIDLKLRLLAGKMNFSPLGGGDVKAWYNF